MSLLVFSGPLLSTVSPAGSVEVEPLQQTVTNGSIVNFSCSADGGPDNTFQWMREDDPSALNYGGDVAISTNSTHSVLTISNVNATQHGGGYRCVVRNAAGNDSDNGTLYVSPVITVQPVETLLTSNGSMEQLMCVADSFPPPVYTWQKLSNAGSFIITSGEPEANANILRFSPVNFGDEGSYRCVAVSQEAEAISQSSLVIGESQFQSL